MPAVTVATTTPRQGCGTDSRRGSRPSGNSTTAQKYATPDTTWKVKCAMETGHGLPVM